MLYMIAGSNRLTQKSAAAAFSLLASVWPASLHGRVTNHTLSVKVQLQMNCPYAEPPFCGMHVKLR
jgi:hypothetical protein